MNSITLTEQVETLRARTAEAVEYYGTTETGFARYAELRGWYQSAILNAAVVAVYGDAYPSAEQLLAGWEASGTRLERAERLAAEAWTLIATRAGIGERPEGYAANVARAVAFTTPKLNDAMKEEARSWTREETATAPYRDDLFSALIEVAARGLQKSVIDDAEAFISGRFYRYPVMDLPRIDAFVAHLFALPEAAKTAGRNELGVTFSVLRVEAGDAMDVLRFGELDKEPEDWQVKRDIKGRPMLKAAKRELNVTRGDRDAVRRLALLERELMLDDAQRDERDRLRTEVGDLLALRDAVGYGDETIDIATADLTAEEAATAVEMPWEKVAALLGVRNGEEAQATIAYALGQKELGVTSMTGASLQQPEDAVAVKATRTRMERASKKVAGLMPEIQEILSSLVAA